MEIVIKSKLLECKTALKSNNTDGSSRKGNVGNIPFPIVIKNLS